MFENSIPTIKESEERKIKTKEILDNMNLKEYLNNDDNFIERFKIFCFKLRHYNPRGSYKLFLEKFPDEKLELDYDFYNKKYFNFKRNIEKQIFELFVAFLKTKIANQICLEGLKRADLEIKVWNICPVHKEKAPSIENINKEIFCTCELI
jgi:hypothetical protein